jgi:preprotein translocase subunit SecF
MSFIRRLYRGEANFDFRTGWRVARILSILLVLISLVSFATRGLNLGIDFEGGTSWEFESSLSVSDLRDILEDFGQDDAQIQTVGDNAVRIKADLEDPSQVAEISQALAEASGVESNEINVEVVGPSWGSEITRAAERALVAFFIAISLYIWVRLEWKMAVGALVATLHDIIVTVGVYSVFQFEVTPATVIAFLTILGYSLYDTIVVYDRARENGARFGATGKMTYAEVMNLSLNQVLMRSINTTITSVLPVLSMLLVGSVALGAAPLQEFSIALLVGLIVGGYSSIFVASPVVAVLKRRERGWAKIESRIGGRESDSDDLSVAEDRVTSAIADDGSYGHPPRPRTGRGSRRKH